MLISFAYRHELSTTYHGHPALCSPEVMWSCRRERVMFVCRIPLLPRLSQAQHYAALRKPYLINDIVEQNVLLDRRYVYRRLLVPALSSNGSSRLFAVPKSRFVGRI